MNRTDDTEGRKTIRGGSWDAHARLVRAAYRSGDSPDYRSDYLGFRVIRMPSEGPERD